MAKTNLTAERLRELLHYDPETGVFTRLVDANNGRWKKGEIVGSNQTAGYYETMIDCHRYLLHRLAWLYMTGEEAPNFIDHRDGNGRNNQWKNLRDATQFVNMQNMRKATKANKSSGLLGVTKAKGKWRMQIHAFGVKTQSLHDTPEEAHAAYIEAKRRLHPGGML